VYRSAECSYTGTNYFDAADNNAGIKRQLVMYAASGLAVATCALGRMLNYHTAGFPGVGTFCGGS
jgi:phage-related protein